MGLRLTDKLSDAAAEDPSFFSAAFLETIYPMRDRLIADGQTLALEVSPANAHRFKGDLYAFLCHSEMRCSLSRVLISMILSGLSRPSDFGPETTVIYIPSANLVSSLLILHTDKNHQLSL